MTGSVLGLCDGAVSVDKIRSSADAMRGSLNELADRGRDLWTGTLAALTDALVEVGRTDLCLARLIEGHSDGLRILDQAGQRPQPGVYGVWASKSVGTGLVAEPVEAADGVGSGWQLRGELRFASGVDLIDRALVPAIVDGAHHVLLDVPADLGKPDRGSWHTSGMDAARTYTIHVDAQVTDAHRVGDMDFYLNRPGFVVGGLCVAAVWAGGAQHVLDVVSTSLRAFPTTPHQLRRLGVIEQAVWAARGLLSRTVSRIEGLPQDAVGREAAMARTAVVQACDTVLDEARSVVGPAGLSRNVRLARALDDLTIYVRQHHIDAALAALGESALTSHEMLAG